MKGAGEHYGGPGMSAFNLYSSDEQGRFSVTLVHGYEQQAKAAVFSKQVLLHSAASNKLSDALALHWKSKRWVSQHAKDFDVYHGLTAFETPVRCAEVAEKCGLPAVVKVAGHVSDLGARQGWRRLLGQTVRRRQVLNRISGVVAISDDIAQELLSYGLAESKIARIPNGVNCDRFSPRKDSARGDSLRERLNLPAGPLVAFCGGINKRKQPHLMLEAQRQLRKRGVECHMVFAGPFDDPEYLAYLRELASANGLERCITFLGVIRNPLELLQVADIFCLPSRLEGMPNALLEAMACGLPCVSTNISGVRDIILDNFNGKLVAQCPSEIALALEMYLNSEPLRLEHGTNARSRMLQNFSAEAVLEAHESLFRRIMAGKPAAG